MLALIQQSLASPREGAARLLALGLPTRVAIEALMIVAALGGLALGLLTGGGLEVPGEAGTMTLSPIGYAVALFVTLVLSGLALTGTGRILGGHGTLPGAFLLMAWLQAIDLALQVGTVLVAILVPPLAVVAAIARVAAVLWCLMGFVGALHGLGPGRSLGTILLGGLGLGLALALLLGLSGMGVTLDV